MVERFSHLFENIPDEIFLGSVALHSDEIVTDLRVVFLEILVIDPVMESFLNVEGAVS